MRELTLHELDAQMAEQLPARELMGGCCSRGGNYNGNEGSFNGVGNGNSGGNGNGILNIGNGAEVNVEL